MLIASKHDGHIPSSCTPAYLKRVAYLDKLPNLKPLIESGFLVEVLANASDAERSQAIDTTESETESESEKKDILRSETGARDGNGSSKTKQMGASAKRTLEKEFSEFYEAYPKKKAKKAAQKAYEKARRDTTHAAIMAGLARAVPTWNEPQYIPYPSTWLNRGCWDDDQTGAQQPSMLTLSNGAKVPMPSAPKGLTGSEYAKWYHDFCEKAERQHAAETHTH